MDPQTFMEKAKRLASDAQDVADQALTLAGDAGGIAVQAADHAGALPVAVINESNEAGSRVSNQRVTNSETPTPRSPAVSNGMGERMLSRRDRIDQDPNVIPTRKTVRIVANP